MTLSIRRISALVLLSIGSVWNILRKNLKLYPYKPEEIRKAVNDILPRASACIAANGGAFEYKLRKHKRDIEE